MMKKGTTHKGVRLFLIFMAIIWYSHSCSRIGRIYLNPLLSFLTSSSTGADTIAALTASTERRINEKEFFHNPTLSSNTFASHDYNLVANEHTYLELSLPPQIFVLGVLLMDLLQTVLLLLH
ncbi:MAG: hypothetical protein WBZ36_25160 [Candidatus Nitrosopolaris sp.]